MDEGHSSPAGKPSYKTSMVVARLVVLLAVLLAPLFAAYQPARMALGSVTEAAASADAVSVASAAGEGGAELAQSFTLVSLLLVLVLIGLSAFFSGSAAAFFSLQPLRMRSMAEDGTFAGNWVASLLDHPSRLLTTILAANCIVNVLKIGRASCRERV